MNIVLIGYRCSGKTTVGKLLARNLGRDFLDTDRLIEIKRGLSIHSYVSQNGWVVWLNADTKVIRKRMRKEGMAGKLWPPLSGADPLDEIDQILQERRPVYEHASDYTVDTNEQSPQEMAQVIMRALSRRDKNHQGGNKVAGNSFGQAFKITTFGESHGKGIGVIIDGCPSGLGEPVFDKLDADLAKAVMSVGAVKVVEIGAGFEAARLKG